MPPKRQDPSFWDKLKGLGSDAGDLMGQGYDATMSGLGNAADFSEEAFLKALEGGGDMLSAIPGMAQQGLDATMQGAQALPGMAQQGFDAAMQGAQQLPGVAMQGAQDAAALGPVVPYQE